jgi:hypothetical protein
VFDGDQRVGRIMLAQQTPEGRPWFWMTARVLQSMDDHEGAFVGAFERQHRQAKPSFTPVILKAMALTP